MNTLETALISISDELSAQGHMTIGLAIISVLNQIAKALKYHAATSWTQT